MPTAIRSTGRIAGSICSAAFSNAALVAAAISSWCPSDTAAHAGDTARRGRVRLFAPLPGIARTDDLVIIQITVSNTRTVEKKQALYRRIAERLTDNAGLRPDDVFISLVEVLPADWSFGHGHAQYVEASG
jgi:phenylpyruvate tautomerase PptA (4-oxalocrotonate tautomerase family)